MGSPNFKGQSQFVVCYISSPHKMDSFTIGKDEKLPDAADMQWFNNAEDAHPVPPASTEVSCSGM